jgi:formylglycine-generating enzyme required for sulfatase activity
MRENLTNQSLDTQRKTLSDRLLHPARVKHVPSLRISLDIPYLFLAGAKCWLAQERSLAGLRNSLATLTLLLASQCCMTCLLPTNGLVIAQDQVPPVFIENADAATEGEMKAYTEVVEQADAQFEMLPIPGGKFLMGSSEDEDEHQEDEGPQREVHISPFWMSKTEVTWDIYDVWMSDLDIFRREVMKLKPSPRDALADQFQLSQPTKPYTDMTFGMGKRGYPAISMTQHAARTFCKWLSAKTGRYYRLPTEAEWEYACRAGTTTAYSFGDDPDELEDYAWFFDNTDDGYERVGKKKPNPWGLHDMHGNVAEWVLDQYDEAGYEALLEEQQDPLAIPKTLYPRVVRGGGWNQFPENCRSAAREGSSEEWIKQDPQVPKSIWYLTDAQHVGFRIVRPLVEPSEDEKANKWDKSEPVQKERVGPKADIRT